MSRLPRILIGEARQVPMRLVVAHIVFRFDYGGLENGIVNLINNLPVEEFDHVVIALTSASDFRARIRRLGVEVHCLNKRPGQDFGAYARLWTLLRRLKPAIVHTRNIGTMDCLFVAWLAGVRKRIHGEHGWDMHDPHGTNTKYLLLRRVLNAFTHRFVTVSQDLERWLVRSVGISSEKVVQICNGVDTARFRPSSGSEDRARLPSEKFPPACIVIGSVMRLTEIKDPLNVWRAFLLVRSALVKAGYDIRLALVGDGPLRQALEGEVSAAGLMDAVWISGSRDDVPELMRAMDVFVLGSKREGISNTVLEAMASGLPVIASANGGNLELIEEDVTGILVPPEDSARLAEAIFRYVEDEALRRSHGAAARKRALERYSLDVMMKSYADLYRKHTRSTLEMS
jgi:sugar transferase (PEP-CTERM/EpsH1 system associated)